MTTFWKQFKTYLGQGRKAVLLYVIHSSGSSPGRQGFRMAVTDHGEMFGTVGGGIMEQKLVELAKSKLEEGPFSPFLKRQIHSPDVTKDRSGMICSGEQTLVFYFIDRDFLPTVSRLLKEITLALRLDQNGIELIDGNSKAPRFEIGKVTETEWDLIEQLHFTNSAYIFGGGHVGLAMSRAMSNIGFRVIVFDDRKDLNTLEQNSYADEIKIINYEESDRYVPEGESSYVIIMSFGYKPDEVIIRRLLGKKFKYIGMMGSRKKIDTMWQKLREDGFLEKELEKVHAPIGLQIHSKTTDEIAISIAAEIIALKNKPDSGTTEGQYS
ncbi:XdhC/CoxI family protein [soil metagenome]